MQAQLDAPEEDIDELEALVELANTDEAVVTAATSSAAYSSSSTAESSASSTTAAVIATASHVQSEPVVAHAAPASAGEANVAPSSAQAPAAVQSST